jgi:hypothetical protein
VGLAEVGAHDPAAQLQSEAPGTNSVALQPHCWKAVGDGMVVVPGITADAKRVHPENALLSMVPTETGMSIAVSATQLVKEKMPIDVRVLESTAERSCGWSRNALRPMSTTESGSTSEVSPDP